jgi:hypothetical protein
MNISEKDIELTPGKLYSFSWFNQWHVWKIVGPQYVYATSLNTGAILFYTGVIKTDLCTNIHYYEFLYMGKLIYMVMPVSNPNVLTKLV